MTSIATHQRPLRCSALSALLRCPGFWTLEQTMADDDHGAAANTGSATGRIVELYHKGFTLGDALVRAEAEAAEKFPMADLEAAARMARRYAADPRNRPDAASHCEAEVRLQLPPDPSDPTGQPVCLRGHIDQLRRDGAGRLRVWDLKCGKSSGLELLYSHAWQLAAYAFACTETLGQEVLPGGIVRMRAYDYLDKKGEKIPGEESAFFEAPWGVEHARVMLDSVRFHVALLRKGDVLLHPGPHCQWCPGVNPAVCQAKF